MSAPAAALISSFRDFRAIMSADTQANDNLAPLPLAGPPPYASTMELDARVAKLEVRADGVERRMEALERKLDQLIDAVNKIAVDLAEVKGRVNSLPNTWQLISLVVAIFGGAFAIIRYGVTP